MDANIGIMEADVPNRGTQVWVTSTVMVIVAGVSVIVRVAARFLLNAIQLDDWMILAALVSSVLLSITTNMAVVNGYGKHNWDMSKEDTIEVLKWFYGANIVYKLAIGCAKVAILIFYLRIFYVQTYFRWACYILIAVTASSTVAFTLATVWQCTPISAFWHRTLPESYCVNNFAAWLSYSLVNIITDFSVLILPVQQVLRLRLSGRDKIALVVVFSLGTFACVASVFRATTLEDSSDYEDATWHSVLATIWSIIECNTAIVCACLSVIGQPVSRLLRKMISRPGSLEDGDDRHLRAHSSRRYRPQPYILGRPSLTASTDSTAPWNKNWDGGDGDVYMASISGGCSSSTHRSGSLEGSVDNSLLEHNGILKQTEVLVRDSTAETSRRAS